MVAGLNALKFNFFNSQPVKERQAGGANLYTTKPQFTTFKGVESSVAAIDHNVTPKNFDTEPTGSSYTNGEGHFKYGMGFAPYLA